jgi:hypothetical protein
MGEVHPTEAAKGYSSTASPGAGKILPYLFTRSIQITPFTVIAKGAMSRAQSEKRCKTIAVMAMPRRTNPPPSIALAKTMGLRVIREKNISSCPLTDLQRPLSARQETQPSLLRIRRNRSLNGGGLGMRRLEPLFVQPGHTCLGDF